MTKAQIVDVFVDGSGNFGGGMGIIIDENRSLTDSERQALAGRLGYEEAIVINNVAKNDVSIYTPQREIPFAGQPLVGAAWQLSRLHAQPITAIHCLGGEIRTWQAGGLTWIRAGLDIMPGWNIKQVPSPDEVERLAASDAGSLPHTLVWAWINEAKGQIRARTFAVDWEIVPEVETNGSGSMMLAHLLKRNLHIRHGKGSLIHAKAEDGNYASVGGRVITRNVLDL
jgi:predicted PhzF superfamily epimerase YddE/YHI9